MSRSRTRKSSARRTPRILPQGVLKMSGAGYGFVQTSEGEFFIPASKTADALMAMWWRSLAFTMANARAA